MRRNMHPVTKLPVLVAFTSGKVASEMESQSDSVIVSKAMDVLRKIFSNQNVPNPVEALVTRWSQDEFSRGSYSFIANGSTGDDYETLSKPLYGKLFFAGEATCRQYPATVHGTANYLSRFSILIFLGAMLSGIRAAASVADVLLGPVTKVKLPYVPQMKISAIKKEESEENIAELADNGPLTPDERVDFSVVPRHLSIVDYITEKFTEADEESEITEEALKDAFDVPIIVKTEVSMPVVERKAYPEPPKRPVASGFLLYRNDYYQEAKQITIQVNPHATHKDFLQQLSRMWADEDPAKKKVGIFFVLIIKG